MNRRPIHASWFVAVVLALGGCESKLQLQVNDAQTGAPVAGAEVTFLCPRGTLPLGVTDASGALRFSLPPLLQMLSVSKPGYGRWTRSATVFREAARSDGIVRLELRPANGSP